MRQHTIYSLTIAGLIPFVIGTVYQINPEMLPPWNWLALIIPYYSAVILAFLGGIQWGVSLSHPHISTPQWLIVSNVTALIAFVSLLLPSLTITLVTLLIGYGIALAADIRIFQSARPPHGYRALRVVITSIVGILLLINIISH